MTFAPDLNPDYPLIITGGNLSLTGFDISSEEQFWTVTGDVANAMTILDFDFDQQKELVVGSDDYSIRVYKNEEMIFDINEESKVQFLSKIEKAAFSYALNNGTVGVYSGSAKQWSARAENRITALLGVDFELDGGRQIMIGYQSGKFEVRNSIDGKVSYKSNMESTISKILYEDYRMEGNLSSLTI
jgi:Bardet-Biedl syndrome 2 protein